MLLTWLFVYKEGLIFPKPVKSWFILFPVFSSSNTNLFFAFCLPWCLNQSCKNQSQNYKENWQCLIDERATLSGLDGLDGSWNLYFYGLFGSLIVLFGHFLEIIDKRLFPVFFINNCLPLVNAWTDLNGSLINWSREGWCGRSSSDEDKHMSIFKQFLLVWSSII